MDYRSLIFIQGTYIKFQQILSGILTTFTPHYIFNT